MAYALLGDSTTGYLDAFNAAKGYSGIIDGSKTTPYEGPRFPTFQPSGRYSRLGEPQRLTNQGYHLRDSTLTDSKRSDAHQRVLDQAIASILYQSPERN